MAKINIDKNFEILNNLVATNDSLTGPEKTSITQNNEVIKILLERLEKRRLGRKSSEKSERKKEKGKKGKGNEGVERNQLPSRRYPDAMVVEKEVKHEGSRACPCCGEKMVDSGMREVSELLEVIPKKYIIVRESREKLRCRKCHGGMVTTPAPARILPGSSYGDSFIMDVTLSKYADLIPMERYASMAADMGFDGLPPNSLIGLTHHLANFLIAVYEKISGEVKRARVIHGDETTHRMLERGGGKQWYLWGFSSRSASYFTIRNTRGGEVAEEFLRDCAAVALVSDAYTGYGSAIRKVNVSREERGEEKLRKVFCNAHARRKFTDMMRTPDYNDEKMEKYREDVESVPRIYKKIYRLEKWGYREGWDKVKFRKGMVKYFEKIRDICGNLKEGYSPRSEMGTAANYFLKHYDGLTECIENPEVPLDNNHQERELRKPVVGRKTWYGTHSKRGADTAAIHFSIVGSCKLNGVSTREYLAFVVGEIHAKREPPTPWEYARLKRQSENPPDTG